MSMNCNKFQKSISLFHCLSCNVDTRVNSVIDCPSYCIEVALKRAFWGRGVALA